MDFDSSLLELWRVIDDTLPIFDKARNEAEIWRLDSLKWQGEARALSSELTKERKDSEERVKSSEESLTREASARKAAEDRAALDQLAITSAQGERDIWRLGAIGAAVVAVASVVWVATK